MEPLNTDEAVKMITDHVSHFAYSKPQKSGRTHKPLEIFVEDKHGNRYKVVDLKCREGFKLVFDIQPHEET